MKNLDTYLDRHGVSTVPSIVYQQLYKHHTLPSEYMAVDYTARRYIEIFFTPQDHIKSMITTSRARALKKYFTFDKIKRFKINSQWQNQNNNQFQQSKRSR